uniref:Uncharacterized protein n=1 Tax=Rhizophora mucronata TaxID=61149 RepID=A0A2P2ILA5_RHIMU
MFLDFLVSIAT